MQNVFIIGVIFVIVEVVVWCYVVCGVVLFLVVCCFEWFVVIVDDLCVCGVCVMYVFLMDINDLVVYVELLVQVWQVLGWVDVVLVVYGMLFDQVVCEVLVEVCMVEFVINGIFILVLLGFVVNWLVDVGSGVLVVIILVVGDRGCQSNYVYGVVKVVVSIYFSGLC